jgi:hypothetical protein
MSIDGIFDMLIEWPDGKSIDGTLDMSIEWTGVTSCSMAFVDSMFE